MASGTIKKDPLNFSGSLTSADIVDSKLDFSDANVSAYWVIRNGICFVRLSDIKTTQTSYSFSKVLTNLPPTSQAIMAYDREGHIEYSMYRGDESKNIYLKTYTTFTVGAKLPFVSFSYPVSLTWHP